MLHSHPKRSSSPSSTSSSTSSNRHTTPTHVILHSIMNNRKSWKTLKGNSEAVWPPYLEATMLKGLQQYEPVDSRETRILGRFPMRNRFISEYIFRKTGKYRSSKQIGSRLQQLRDTSDGRELIDSLTRSYLTRSEPASLRSSSASPHHNALHSPSSRPFLPSISCDSPPQTDSSSSASSDGSPISPTQYSPIMPSSSSKHNQLPDSRTPVYIEILPQSSSPSHLQSSPYKSHHPVIHPSHSSNTPRHMIDIDPTVTFVSPTVITGKSSYILLLDGAPIHSEDTKLECIGPYFTDSIDGPVLYSTALVPKFWDTLCKSPDPTLYTIIQDVYRTPDPAPPGRTMGRRPRPVPIFSATYHFRYPVSVHTPPPPLSQSQSPHFTYQAADSHSPFLANNNDEDGHVYSDRLNPIRPLPFHNYHHMTPSPSLVDHDHDHDHDQLQGRQQPVQWYERGTNATRNCDHDERVDESFMLNGGFDQFSLDDFMIDIHDSAESECVSKEILTHSAPLSSSLTSSFSKDICHYGMGM